MTHIKTSRQLLAEIEKAIKAAGFSNRALQKRCGISASTLFAIRNRGGNMTTDTMLALAKELGVKVRVER